MVAKKSSYPRQRPSHQVAAVRSKRSARQAPAMLERLSQLSRAVEQGPVSVVITDTRGVIEYINPRFTQVTGYTPGELIGQNIRMLNAGKQNLSMFRDLWKTIRQGLEWRGEFLNRKKDGEVYWVSAQISSITDARGKITHYLAIEEDIADRKRAEEELARTAAILSAVNFAAEQFLRTASWREHIDHVIARLGEATRVSRVYLFENRYTESGRLIWRQLYEWVAAGIMPQIDSPILQEFDVVIQGFSRWIGIMQKGDLVQGNVRDLPLSEQVELVAEDIKSIVCVPVFVNQTWWGFIGFDDCVTEHAWSSEVLDALIAAASTLGAAIEREQSDRELRTRASELEAIRQASLSLTSSLELSEVLDAIVKSALDLMPDAMDAHIYLFQEGRLIFGTSLWRNGHRGEQWSEPRPDGLTYTVARTGDRIVVPDMQAHLLFESTPWRGAIIGLPLKIAKRIVGVMTIACMEPHHFSDNELRTLDLLGTQAAIAIENASLYDQVQQLAITDPLTNIYNRRGFFQIGESEVERARRFGHTLSALMFDVDHFKRINDTYGHPFGDKILAAMIQVCSKQVRTLDVLGRYGGEEFVALLPEADASTAIQIAERVRLAVEQTKMQIDDTPISITISIGVATLDGSVTDLAVLLDRADQAMYRAKQSGRNRVCEQVFSTHPSSAST